MDRLEDQDLESVYQHWLESEACRQFIVVILNEEDVKGVSSIKQDILETRP